MSAEKWSLGTFEKGKIVANAGSKFKIWMGKVMPFIKFSTKPTRKLVALDKSCLINDPKCKPTIASQVHTVNYMTVPASARIISGKVKKGTEVKVEVRNHSVDQLTVTNYTT